MTSQPHENEVCGLAFTFIWMFLSTNLDAAALETREEGESSSTAGVAAKENMGGPTRTNPSTSASPRVQEKRNTNDSAPVITSSTLSPSAN